MVNKYYIMDSDDERTHELGSNYMKGSESGITGSDITIAIFSR